MKKFLIVLTALLCATFFACAQEDEPGQEKINREIFERVYAAVKDKADLPTGALALEIAKQFDGTQYAYYTLEKVPEQLRVYLDKTDCILFVELCSSFALTVKGEKIVQTGDGVNYCVRETPSVEKAVPSYELLCHNIQNMRYRLGIVDGYASRLHYTSEWILQNQTNGILEELTPKMGQPINQSFFFMTTHQNSYKQLIGHPDQYEIVREAERRLSAQAPYFLLTQEDLRKPEIISQIQEGDIITFQDKHPGLDLAHVAMACKGADGQMHFIHAGVKYMKVCVDPMTLADYAKNGLRVSRLR